MDESETKHVFAEIKHAVCRTNDELLIDHSYSEAQYQNALRHYLQKLLPHASCATEVVLPYRTTDRFVFGYGRIDILVETEDSVTIVELKIRGAKLLGAENQTRRYMAHYKTEKPLFGVVVVFGSFQPVVRYLTEFGTLISSMKTF